MAPLAGRSVLAWTLDAARGADVGPVLVATESADIAEHARALGAEAVMTPADCATGSDRALAAVGTLSDRPEIVVNLQGDAPLTPPGAIRAVVEALAADPGAGVATPVRRLSWEALDALREAKKTAPFSGTTAVVGPDGRALWFSKMVLPAIRREDRAGPCPVLQHIGLYAFRLTALERFCTLPEAGYERLEGLEQLRLVEAGIPVRAVEVPPEHAPPMGGIDTPEDLARAEVLLAP